MRELELNMKKYVMSSLGMLLLLAGCSSGENNSSTSSTSSTSSSVSQMTEKSTSNLAVSATSESSKNSNSKESSTTDMSNEYPYDVSLDAVKAATFYNNGMNLPQEIALTVEQGSQGTASFTIKSPDGDFMTSYAISYQQNPTKTIRIFSADTHEIRTVKVNTELVLGDRLFSDQNRVMTGNLYVFVNKSGGLSLATPNYAGNVDEQDSDVMLEYLQNK